MLQSLDESQKSTHKKLDAIQLGVQKLLKASGSAQKPLVREKHVNCDTEQLRVALHDKSQAGLESVQAEYQLSSAMYKALSSKSLLSREQMLRIKNVLEAHKTLNELTNNNKVLLDKIEKAMRGLKLKISQVDKIHVESKAVMANHVKPKSKIFRPGAS